MNEAGCDREVFYEVRWVLDCLKRFKARMVMNGWEDKVARFVVAALMDESWMKSYCPMLMDGWLKEGYIVCADE